MKNYYYCDKNSIITVKSRQIVFFYYVASARQVWNKNLIQITTYQFKEPSHHNNRGVKTNKFTTLGKDLSSRFKGMRITLFIKLLEVGF